MILNETPIRTSKNQMSHDKTTQIKLLQRIAKQSIFTCKVIDKLAKRFKQTNEQWFIDWQDELNKISVADPNKG